MTESDRPEFHDEYPFQSHTVEIDHLPYHYIDEGEGEVLLMVHGNPTWSFAFRNLVKALSARYRCIAVDHIGCGFSAKPYDYEYTLARHIGNLSTFVQQLGLERITLIGHDWGGAIGLGCAGRAPDLFSRLILFNTGAFRSDHMPWRIRVCRTPLLGALGVRGLNLFARAAQTMAVTKRARMRGPIRAGYLAPYDSWATRVAIHQFVLDIPTRADHPSYETLVGVEKSLLFLRDHPALLIWGARDWCFTTDFLHEFERRLPRAETMLIPDAGHYVFEDAADEIVPRIQQFLDEHPLSTDGQG